jgi:hypothetical protein
MQKWTTFRGLTAATFNIVQPRELWVDGAGRSWWI